MVCYGLLLYAFLMLSIKLLLFLKIDFEAIANMAKLANFTKMKRTVKGNCCAVKKDLQLHKSDGSVSSTGNATENSSWSLPPVDCCPLTIIHSQCFSPKLSFLVIIVFGKFPLVANVITESSAWPWAQQYWNLTLQCTWQDVFNCTDWTELYNGYHLDVTFIMLSFLWSTIAGHCYWIKNSIDKQWDAMRKQLKIMTASLPCTCDS